MRDDLARCAFALTLLATAAAAQEPASGAWEISSTVLYSDPPGSSGHLIPILYADRGPLHLEARYNYEDLHTGSLFAGWTLSAEGDISVSATPMLGGVAGDTDGIAPGFEFDLGWQRLSWYAEMEYLFDLEDSDDNFFYSWSTLTYGFTDSLRAGLVTERTKLVETDFSYQRGVALEYQLERVGLSLYVYNLASDDFYAVVGVEVGL